MVAQNDRRVSVTYALSGENRDAPVPQRPCLRRSFELTVESTALEVPKKPNAPPIFGSTDKVQFLDFDRDAASR